MANIKLKLIKHAVINGSVEWAGTEVSVDASEASRLIAGEFANAPTGTKELTPKDATIAVPVSPTKEAK